MRLFAAVVPPENVLDSLESALARASVDDPALRWAGRERWHLTLAFYGEDDLAARTAWLEPRLRDLGPLRLHITGAGRFTGVLWSGIGGDLDALQALAAAAGADAEDRPYHPHLTLARWRQPRRPPSVAPIVTALRAYRSPDWEVSEVVLMRSTPSGRRAEGPTYTPQAQFPLT